MNEQPIPQLHDAELVGLNRDGPAGAIECSFRCPVDGKVATLRLLGVQSFRCTDFGLQNVVLETVIISGEGSDVRELERHLRWIATTSDNEFLTNSDQLARTLQAIESGRLVLVVIIPSWGAQLAAVARNVEWS